MWSSCRLQLKLKLEPKRNLVTGKLNSAFFFKYSTHSDMNIVVIKASYQPHISMCAHTCLRSLIRVESVHAVRIFYECQATDTASFWVSKLKRRLHKLLWVYICQNATLLEISCHGSIMNIYTLHPVCASAQSCQSICFPYTTTSSMDSD